MSEQQQGRSGAGWVTVSVAVAVLLAVVGLLAVQLVGPSEEAQPELTVGRAHQVGESFHLPVTVRNAGDDTAANVQVSSSLVIDGETVAEGDQGIDFLSGGEEVDLVFVLGDDPADGTLSVDVTGFTVP